MTTSKSMSNICSLNSLVVVERAFVVRSVDLSGKPSENMTITMRLPLWGLLLVVLLFADPSAAAKVPRSKDDDDDTKKDPRFHERDRHSRGHESSRPLVSSHVEFDRGFLSTGSRSIQNTRTRLETNPLLSQELSKIVPESNDFLDRLKQEERRQLAQETNIADFERIRKSPSSSLSILGASSFWWILGTSILVLLTSNRDLAFPVLTGTRKSGPSFASLLDELQRVQSTLTSVLVSPLMWLGVGSQRSTSADTLSSTGSSPSLLGLLGKDLVLYLFVFCRPGLWSYLWSSGVFVTGFSIVQKMLLAEFWKWFWKVLWKGTSQLVQVVVPSPTGQNDGEGHWWWTTGQDAVFNAVHNGVRKLLESAIQRHLQASATALFHDVWDFVATFLQDNRVLMERLLLLESDEDSY